MSESAPPGGTREHIIAATMELVVRDGRDAVSTRAVCAAAGVQAPTIYRLFGDKQGLLDAVADVGFRSHLSGGVLDDPSDDPVEDLRRGWDMHLAFGLGNPYLYSLAYGGARPGYSTTAAVVGTEIVAMLVRRIAVVGRLRVPERRAVELLTAAGIGTTFLLIAMPEPDRDLALADRMREAVLAEILADAVPSASDGPVGAAVHLRAALGDAAALTDNERDLMRDWLDRIARDPD